jgi:hypothetical protein
MSEPILITTSTYTGPDRRGIFMSDQDDRRQSQEVAIARLEVNVEYIKIGLDELRGQLRLASNTDCDAMEYIKRLEKETDERLQNMVSSRRFALTTMVAVCSLGLVLLQILLKLLKLI